MGDYKKLLAADELVEIMYEKADDDIANEIFDELSAMHDCNAEWERCFPYNGYEIYMPVLEGISRDLLPAIAIKKGEARLMTKDEISNYLKQYKVFMR